MVVRCVDGESRPTSTSLASIIGIGALLSFCMWGSHSLLESVPTLQRLGSHRRAYIFLQDWVGGNLNLRHAYNLFHTAA